MILTGGAVAAAVPFAALVGLHVIQGPEGHNDPSSPVPERAGPGALVKAGALRRSSFPCLVDCCRRRRGGRRSGTVLLAGFAVSIL